MRNVDDGFMEDFRGEYGTSENVAPQGPLGRLPSRHRQAYPLPEPLVVDEVAREQ